MTSLQKAKFEKAFAEAKALGSPNDLGSVSNSEDEVKAECKKASQLLAKSWLPEGKDIRAKLLELSANPTKDPSKTSEEIVALFKEHNVDLRKIFPLTNLRFAIDWDSFFTTVSEKYQQVTIPYPPRPSEKNVTDEELQAWLDDKDPERYYPPTPYIPYSCL